MQKNQKVRHAACAWVCVVYLLVPTAAQTPQPARRASFEVTSVKPSSSTSPSTPSLNIGSDSFAAINYPLWAVINRAYGVSSQQVEGLPWWAQTQHFDVRAKASQAASSGEILEMVRSLLEERFKLRVHRERRVVDGYVLGIDRAKYPGSGLHPINLDCATNTLNPASAEGLFPPDARPRCGIVVRARNPKRGVEAQHQYVGFTLPQFAAALQTALGRQVRDQTNIAGVFDIELTYAETLGTDPKRTGWSFKPNEALMQEVMRTQLGLVLRADRASADYLIVDSIDRPEPD